MNFLITTLQRLNLTAQDRELSIHRPPTSVVERMITKPPSAQRLNSVRKYIMSTDPLLSPINSPDRWVGFFRIPKNLRLFYVLHLLSLNPDLRMGSNPTCGLGVRAPRSPSRGLSVFRLAAAIFGFGLMLEGPSVGLPTGSVGPDALTTGISSPAALRSVCLLDLPHHLGCGRGAICYFGYRVSDLFVSVPPSILWPPWPSPFLPSSFLFYYNNSG